MVDIDFLKRLRQKLQIGNSRSIHLNAYPGRYAMRLDLSDLNFIRKELPELFISE